MFKRIAKKQKKQEDEDALGLDWDAKEILGMHDTDSDESESESDSDSGADDTGVHAASDDESQGDGGGDDPVDEVNESTIEAVDELPMTTEEAMQNPVYAVAGQSHTINLCVTCPGKLLKTPNMIDLHLEAAAHKRRFKQFLELLREMPSIPDDPRQLVAMIPNFAFQQDVQETKGDGLSKRAMKRKLKIDALKKKRAAQKAMKAKAKKKREAQRARAGSGDESDGAPSGEAPQSPQLVKQAKRQGSQTTDGDSRPEKKRKVEDTHAPARYTNASTPVIRKQTSKHNGIADTTLSKSVRFASGTKPVSNSKRHQPPPRGELPKKLGDRKPGRQGEKGIRGKGLPQADHVGRKSYKEKTGAI